MITIHLTCEYICNVFVHLQSSVIMRCGKLHFSGNATSRVREVVDRNFLTCFISFQLMQKLRAENEKLKAENRALTRVVSKLTK